MENKAISVWSPKSIALTRDDILKPPSAQTRTNSTPRQGRSVTGHRQKECSPRNERTEDPSTTHTRISATAVEDSQKYTCSSKRRCFLTRALVGRIVNPSKHEPIAVSFKGGAPNCEEFASYGRSIERPYARAWTDRRFVLCTHPSNTHGLSHPESVLHHRRH